MSWWSEAVSAPGAPGTRTGDVETSFVLSEIKSTMDPLIEVGGGILEFNVTNLSDSVLTYLEDGEMAIYYTRITDFVAASINEGDTVKLYYGISSLGVHGDLDVSTDTSSTPVTITVTYASAEREKLRDLFGQPEGSTVGSLIDDAITAVGQFASSMNLDTRFKSDAVKTQAFTDADLTILTDEEAAQGISLSMSSALTRVKEAEAPAEGEAEAASSAPAVPRNAQGPTTIL